MANQVYPSFKDAILGAYFGLIAPPATPELWVYAVNASYFYNASHSSFDDLTGIVAEGQPFINVTITDGVVDGNDLFGVFGAVDETIAAFVIVMQDGNGPTDPSQLVCYIDSAADLSIPVDTGNRLVDVVWDAAGVFGV